jgi:hypothetical protein
VFTARLDTGNVLAGGPGVAPVNLNYAWQLPLWLEATLQAREASIDVPHPVTSHGPAPEPCKTMIRYTELKTGE